MARTDDEFDAFVRASFGQLTRTGYLICGDWHKAEDAAQAALLRLHPRWNRVAQKEAYARRALVTILIDESRRPWRRDVRRPAACPTTANSPCRANRPKKPSSELYDSMVDDDSTMTSPKMTRKRRIPFRPGPRTTSRPRALRACRRKGAICGASSGRKSCASSNGRPAMATGRKTAKPRRA